jgi:hypothetical protein
MPSGIALAASLVATPSIARRASAQVSFAPAVRYTLSGCWDGVSCHTAQLTLYDILVPPAGYPPPIPAGYQYQAGDRAIAWQVTHQFLSGGTAVAGTGLSYQYAVQGAGGTLKVVGSDFDFWSATFCLGNGFLRPAGTTCTDANPFFGQLTGRVAPAGWSPVAIPLSVAHAADANRLVLPTDERRTIVMQLVSTEVLSTPEPATVALVATGMVGMLGMGAARRRRATAGR